MEFSDGFVSEEHGEMLKSATQSIDPISVSPVEVTSPRSPRTPRGKSNSNQGSPVKHSRHSHSGKDGHPSKVDPISVSPVEVTSPRSPRTPHGKSNSNKGSPIKHGRHSHSRRDGRPKKGGSGGKGTWGGLLDSEAGYYLDPNDPNYDSSEENYQITPSKTSADLEEFKKKATVIVEEYFVTDDIMSTANELRDLGWPSFHYYFVKKLVSMAMDRHDKEKEMAAVLLSTLYAEIIDPPQVYKGFGKLVESSDDLSVDIPDAVDILAVFIARAVVDDILPPAFLAKQMASLPKDSKGIEVIKRAEKSYLSAPLHAETILRRWGGSKNTTVEEVKNKINNLLIEYIASGDKAEACRCIKDLKVPFFHHEIVKRALILAMERQTAEGHILDFLKVASEEGLINSSQISKGFNRLIDTIDDLSLDIPTARDLLQSLISKAASEGWLCASSLKSLYFRPEKQVEDGTITLFKTKATSIIQEYFLTGDIIEVINSLESENLSSSTPLNAIFIKKLITLAMDRKNREKEMASVLLSSLCFPADDIVTGFVLLIESAEDAALDIPAIVEDLAMFLARAVVDEVLAPLHLDEMGNQCGGPDSIGSKVLRLACSLLGARLSGERILRCWGGGGSNRTGWEINDVKDKIGKLLEEYDSGGDLREACRCIKELGMPFFHHEVVKKALVTVMEKKNERLWGLLEECYSEGLITPNQMMKGFGRVADSIDDLVLDVPDVEKQFAVYVERAKKEGWLDPSFSTGNSGCS
ncbi:MA3 DOMAIN-CONTAINING TRANSLATION REGULATORY FACTOR 2 isoform X1 [Phoenix dactylifera]|uniref:MA3 DOMAIN-CONTAINING TRANSLATION REGULATORY FACTOR 2 isoform X1 n=1 Tax=Phoenix dactylifera TaxID=42345 RepID=A0A8B8IZR9_PHODC|nr:MA3 DOMAIN-CONTAINING TRANSLATION REGULATORY FACTOR 2 isoform X1 [Phoenix dactylifera]XP_038984897.1 MA3 DOMAIN-CONTAINING TRANSLATION REGULATORY FACTOR 2 isoform X1 [Phoenix dactylifera]XP_038984898.1 MA3 DOMAIN-CONTAINING TRANSLATION REGULATORY FACTOR 2 isoform X1 [Phoenix dactylifera]